jgi:glyoxylase-like metal-dependent hydrolase (beta-lactamase superfamily II)
LLQYHDREWGVPAHSDRKHFEVLILSGVQAGLNWSPISSTLISGKRDAVLVDTAITIDQNQKLVDWIAASGKNLTTIYATHGHGDHFFGVNTIQKKFPKARFMATQEVIAVIQKQASAPVVNGYWKPRFPGQIDSTLVVADELRGGVVELEGEQLVSVPLGHTDTDNTTCLHARSIGLVVAGDRPITMFIFISESQTLKQGRLGSRRSTQSSL